VPARYIENTSDWQPIEEKKPLFTTEDGVEYLENGAEYFIVGVDYSIFWQEVREFYVFEDDVKRFSTEEAAEEYVRMNKPMYSRKDMEEFTYDFIKACRVVGYSLVELDEFKKEIKKFRK